MSVRRIKPKVTIVNKINNGRVCSTTKFSTAIGLIIDNTPITRKIFAIFEPITFPTAISLCPIRAADIVPANWGRLGPTAPTLKPITISGIPTANAISTA